ncbi:hypothetical protein LUCX_160 [Xanthomonas phage vB_XciM_LucasX]|nr:hypothetical protein LUCX_160 [Xanthomonas phage vB_XciM_LucasX]
MFDLFRFLLELAGCVAILFSLFVLYHIVRPQDPPADTSNRINKIRLLWFCLTREALFTKTFPWLKHDELDNVSK